MGLLFVLVAGVAWGTLSIYVNVLQGLGFSSVLCSVIRYLFSFLILFVVLLITDKKQLKIKRKDIPLFLLAGGGGLAGFSLTYFLAMQEIGGASVPSLLLNTAPILVMAASPFLFKEKITSVQLISMFVCIAGITLVTGVFGGAGEVSFLGILYGLISAIAYAAYIVVTKILLKKYGEYTVSTYAMLFAVLCLLPLSFGSSMPTAFGWKGFLAAAGLVLVGTLFPFLLYSKGLKKISASTASVFGTVDPATSCLVGLFYFQEGFSFLKILGVLLVLGAIAMQAFGNKKQAPKEEPPQSMAEEPESVEG